jgi:MYXO-CTERM domain-containing protein
MIIWSNFGIMPKAGRPMRIAGLLMILLAVEGFAVAGGVVVPEIDPATGIGALALLGGALLVVRARRKQ